MTYALSANAQAILLLTASFGRRSAGAGVAPLSPGEYKRFALALRGKQRQPADLLGPDAEGLLQEISGFDTERLRRLLERGFLLSQTVEHWRSRAIWVLSRADDAYPKRLKERLKENAPAILYGCGERALLEGGGLAVVGSRNVDEDLIQYAEGVGRLTAAAKQTLVSGGARGIDLAAMRGALDDGGAAVAVVADSLERLAMQRENRDLLLENRLALISPYDPSAGFNVGQAMQRNKLIYALADCSLVVSSDLGKGGTWSGAIEQLDRYRFVPLYFRNTGEVGPGLRGLEAKGARPWPEPRTVPEILAVLEPASDPQRELLIASQGVVSEVREPGIDGVDRELASDSLEPAGAGTAAIERSAAEAGEALRRRMLALSGWNSETAIVAVLGVSRAETRMLLKMWVSEGLLETRRGGVAYRVAGTGTAQLEIFSLESVEVPPAHGAARPQLRGRKGK